MKTETRTVTAADGETRKADFAVCKECGYDIFMIFEVEGHDHPHFQCCGCGTSFCSVGGECYEKELVH